MKKAKSTTRRSAAKGSVAPKTVDEYIASIPDPARTTLNKVRAALRAALPAEAIEGISYQIPVFKYQGPLVWFAAFSKHCSLFPGASVIKKLKNELKDYPTSKGTIQFAVDKPLPAALVKRIVRERMAEQERKQG